MLFRKRIWKTFLIENAPLELNVKNKQAIGDEIKLHKWGIITKTHAIDLFRDAESEVKIFLVCCHLYYVKPFSLTLFFFSIIE